MYAFRWLLSLLSPAFGLVTTFVAAVFFTYALERLCPPELMVSGTCTAPWLPASEKAAFALASFLGALGFVSLPALAAPEFKRAVAWIAFSAGLTFAAIFVWQAGLELLPSLVSSIAAGSWAAARFNRQGPNAA